VFDAEGELFTDPRFKGCAFEMASAEAAPGGAVERAAGERTLFTTLAQDAGAHMLEVPIKAAKSAPDLWRNRESWRRESNRMTSLEGF
jgi:hypothetical protein